MRVPLALSAVIELGAGLGMLLLPSPLAVILLGSSLDTAVSATVARVAGLALIALGISCWFVRYDGKGRAARGVLGAMVLYNIGACALLVFVGAGLQLTGIGWWPAVLVHGALGVWCVASLIREKP